MCEDTAELPRYQCHKVVHADKIDRITLDADVAGREGRETDGSAVLALSCRGSVRVERGYLGKHDPHVGGYYVLYPGGYESFSPAEPFESGYSLI